MPWLAATALLHSCSVLASRNALRTWTVMLGVVAFSMSMVGTFLVRSGILTSVHAFAVDPERGAFILVLLAIYIGGALTLFGLRASTVTEGERFSVVSRESALVANNVMLSCTLGIVLVGTLYPLLAESLGQQVSIGPPYFNPFTAIFVVPMLLVMLVGPLLRWRNDSFARVRRSLIVPVLLAVAALIAAIIVAPGHVLPIIGLALAPAIAVASLLPLRGRKLRQVKLALWGMVLAHFGVGVSLFGMASDSAFTTEKLVAVNVGDRIEVGPWQITLKSIDPVAGPNWTALEAEMQASYNGSASILLHPQSRSFWTSPQQTSESALVTRWNGQLYAVLGDEAEDGRWQLRLWWKPFVPMIWLGGILIALGGVLALLGRIAADLRRIIARGKIAYRRERQGR
jgi:cytochrome c-type biogenesis protein CcmF